MTLLLLYIFYIPIQIPDQDFKKMVTLVQKRALPFVTTAKPSEPNYSLHHVRCHQ